MRVIESPKKPGFRRIHILLMIAAAVVGAVLIWISLLTHPQLRSHVDVLNTRQPMNVLVAVQGSPLDPGFLGLVAVVKPNTRVLTVIPISGETLVSVGPAKEPLYQAVSNVSPKKATQLISRASGVPINHYFFLTGQDLLLVINALYYHSPNWPKSLTPLTMLKTLGYPSGHVVGSQELKLISQVVQRVPLINPIAASSLLAITKTSVTNLTFNQLFLLANYVRGDPLRQGSAKLYQHHHRRTHG